MNAANKVPRPPARRPGSPAPSWRSWRPYYGASTTAAPVSASQPSYEAIAERADCARSVVAEARKALEWAGVLTWQNRITRVWERCRDLFGRDGWRWRLEVRTSNAYIFRDPKAPSFPVRKSVRNTRSRYFLSFSRRIPAGPEGKRGIEQGADRAVEAPPPCGAFTEQLAILQPGI